MVRFKNIHSGKRIWVCGTGPSLLKVNECDLVNDVIIACNSAMLHFNHPNYSIFVDAAVQKHNWFTKISKTQVCINLNEVIKRPNRKTVNIFGQSSEWGDWLIKETHYPGNIPHRAVSFANIMGASEIILAGCDCKGGHPYDKPVKKNNFANDIYLWQMMVENNPKLNIRSISKGTPIKYEPYKHLIC